MSPLYEYVLSGPQFLRLTQSAFQEKEMRPMIQAGYDRIKSDFYDFSLLFNAWTEERIGKPLMERIPHERVYVDSGGLQLATRNMAITPAIKKQIYRTQSLGDIAMCFDEIPLHVDNFSKSHRASTANKWFVESRAHASAVTTGHNVNEQARIFAEMGAKTKIMLIAQGNEAHDFAQFLETQFAQIDTDLHQYIGGIALADTCCGNGHLESIEMIRGLMMCELPEEVLGHVHLLGVGTIARMSPFIELYRSGAWKVDKISFDSSTHSSSFIMGRLNDEDGKTKNITRSASPEYVQFLGDVYDLFLEQYFPNMRMQYAQHILNNMGQFSAKAGTIHNDLDLMAYLTHYFFVILVISRFMRSIESVHNDIAQYERFVSSKMMGGIRMLSQCSTSQDIEKQHFDLKRVFKTNRIPRIHDIGSSMGLDSLFE
jgi:hypothetical protein